MLRLFDGSENKDGAETLGTDRLHWDTGSGSGGGRGAFEVHPTRHSIVNVRPTSAGYVPQQRRLKTLFLLPLLPTQPKT